MAIGRRIQTSEYHARLLRQGILESVHHVQAVMCDSRGRALMAAGSPETATFIRSALKPFQAMAVTSSGTLDRFQLGDRDLAIICSSHRGLPQQSRQAFNILWRADIEPSALQCPTPAGKASPLEYNCSGKHAGMLAVCKHGNWSLAEYLQLNHPVQQLILQKVSDLLRMPGAELIAARDDCGAPTFYMQLQQMATLYAQLASGESLDMERIIRAMTGNPELIAGPGEFDTELMRLSVGELVCKGGAEGVLCIARVGEGQGLAIKAMDGSKRAKYAVAIQALAQMGWISPGVAEDLAEQFLQIGPVSRLELAGEMVIL
jgi:L-asparaginase